MIYIAAGHQGAIKMVWLHFLPIFLHIKISLLVICTSKHYVNHTLGLDFQIHCVWRFLWFADKTQFCKSNPESGQNWFLTTTFNFILKHFITWEIFKTMCARVFTCRISHMFTLKTFQLLYTLTLCYANAAVQVNAGGELACGVNQTELHNSAADSSRKTSIFHSRYVSRTFHVVVVN